MKELIDKHFCLCYLHSNFSSWWRCDTLNNLFYAVKGERHSLKERDLLDLPQANGFINWAERVQIMYKDD